MVNLENKLKNLLKERENIIMEINELQKSLEQRNARLIQISGSLNTLQELIDETNKLDESIDSKNK